MPEPNPWVVLTVIAAVLILQKQLTSLWLNSTLCVQGKADSAEVGHASQRGEGLIAFL